MFACSSLKQIEWLLFSIGITRSRKRVWFHPATQGEKNIWVELDSIPGPHALQATTLTAKPKTRAHKR